MSTKKNQKTTIYVLGTTHVSKKSAKLIEILTKKIKFDCIFSEGVSDKTSYKLKNILKEPFILIGVYVYYFFLKYFIKDQPVLDKINKEKTVPIINIDRTLDELINDFHKWYNYLIHLFLLILFGIWSLWYFPFSGIPLFIKLVIAFLCSVLFYFGYFAIIGTKKEREDFAIRKIIKKLKKEKYKNVLIVYGNWHIKRIEKELKSKHLFDVISANKKQL